MFQTGNASISLIVLAVTLSSGAALGRDRDLGIRRGPQPVEVRATQTEASGAAAAENDQGSGAATDGAPHLEPKRLMRLTAGMPYLHFNGSVREGSSQDEFTVQGLGFGVRPELLFRVSPALYLGGSAMLQAVPRPRFSIDGEELTPDDVSLRQLEFAVVLEYRFPALRGTRVQASAGWASVTVVRGSGEDEVKSEPDTGWVLATAIAHEFQLSRAVTLGPELRLAYGKLSNEHDGIREELSLFAPTLGVTLTHGGW